MREFDISFDEVEKIASDLRSRAEKMKSILDDITVKVNEVHSDAWHSSAAEVHLNEYNALKSKYSSFYEKVKGCAEFLDKAVTAGREIEAGLNNPTN